MGLYNRLSADDGTKISVHALTAGLTLWALGSSVVGREQVINKLGLSGDDITDLDALAGVYTSLQSVTDKIIYLLRFEQANILVEEGFYTEALWRQELGI